jgi:hypothetical protein
MWRFIGRAAGHGLAVAALTALTQLGGLASLSALLFRRRLLAFALAYAALWGGAMLAAPLFGRVPVPCLGAPLRAQSAFYYVLNRHYAGFRALAEDLACHMAARAPGTITLALDAGFPFLGGFPLLPHLSHDDSEKLDFAFYYTDEEGRYLPGATRPPLEYFAFEEGPSDCPPASPRSAGTWPGSSPSSPAARSRAGARAKPSPGFFPIPARHACSLSRIGPKASGFLGKSSASRAAAPRHDDHVHVEL